MKFIWRKKIIFSLLAFSLALGLAWFFTSPASAQTLNTGINFVANTGLTNQDPRVTVAKIIRIALGFLGIIAVGLMLYAGFIWMTAKGDEEKIGQARKIMTSAAIGLIIILAAFGIASFILSRFLGATNGNGGNGGGGGGGFGGGSDVFMVDGTTPANQSVNVIRNAVIRFHFTKGVLNSSVNENSFKVVSVGAIIPEQINGKNPVGVSDNTILGQRNVNGNYIEFVPEANCDAPNDTIKCLPKNTTINVTAEVGTIISAGDNKPLICSGSSQCIIQFTTGEIVDTKAPSVNITSQQVCAAANNTITASSIDDYGVSKIDFYVADGLIGSSINNSNPFVGSPFNASVDWNAAGYQVGQTIKLKATAYDLDSNETSAEKAIRLSASHCCNSVQDGDETGIDCGGSCLACTAQACAADRGTPSQCSDTLCASSYCSASGSEQNACEAAGYPKGTTDCCLCQAHPTIQWVSPAGGFCSNNENKFCHKETQIDDCGKDATCDLGTPNGAIGNFVTIAGNGFGSSRGHVYFVASKGGPIEVNLPGGGSQTLVEAKLADDVSGGNPDCSSNVWKNNQIIAIVPKGASLEGPITIETADGVRDVTNDAYGPLVNDFKINTVERPGVCAISPGSGKSNDVLSYQGVKLNEAEAYYGNLSNNVKSPVSSFTTSKEGTASVPSLNSGETTTFVKKADVESNFLPFVKEGEPYNGPVIASFDPISGPVGQYLTIRGSGFGDTRGTSKILFSTTSLPPIDDIEADYSFPQICSQSVWTDKQIIVKVPVSIQSARSYKIILKRDGFNDVDSGTRTFEVKTGSPNPGLCLIQPILGQANSEVTLWGEYFKDKDANSAVRFYNNLDQKNNNLTFWKIDDLAEGNIKPWKVITTVPQSAATGPVRIVVGETAQTSNSFNFSVGQCTKNEDCGNQTGATCCAAGLPEAGKCKDTALACYGMVDTSVYEWRFSTGNQASCAPDQEKCGTVCCAKGNCENAAENKCTHCLSSQNECGNGKCCNMPCQPGINGGPSTCSDPNSCSGYSYNQCIESFYCPSAPGVCSPSGGTGEQINAGQECGDDYCNLNVLCKGKSCHYDATSNYCVKNNLPACKKSTLKDDQNQPISSAVGVCDSFDNGFHWYLNNWTSSCPSGWTRLFNNRCVDPGITINGSLVNGLCSKCTGAFTCDGPDTSGQCVIKQPVCPSGSTCDLKSGQCTKKDTGTCSCCCRKKPDPKADCCNGLNCEDSCGSGQSNLGLCSGCVIDGKPIDTLCNCLHTTGMYCDPSNPKGVCRECASITDPAECSRHDECCVDGKNNNRCTSVAEGGSRFQADGGSNDGVSNSVSIFNNLSNGFAGPIIPPTSDGLFYCSYFNCTDKDPNACDERPVKDGTYNTLTTCQQSCATAPIRCSTEANCANASCPGAMRCDEQTCTCKGGEPTVGEPCHDPSGACNLTCSSGYQCLLPSIYNSGGQDSLISNNNNNQGDTTGGNNDSCLCCCKPLSDNNKVDTCKQIDPALNCIADKQPCSSPEKTRGLCCGCSKDVQCGDVSTVGCSTTDTCCRTRPTVVDHLPAVSANDVCRNSVIEATFDQKMDITTFSKTENNVPFVSLIADFGTKSCPTDYTPVAQTKEPNGTIASIIFSTKKFLTKVFPALLTKSAFADYNHYCYVKGSAIGIEANQQQTKVSFRITRALDPGIKYYMVLMGDPDLNDISIQKDYYSSKITNLDSVGMIGSVRGKDIPESFANTTFKNAEIWSFTTGKDICTLDKVSVNPSFQLFQKAGQTGSLEANPLDNNNNEIQPLDGVYSWSWSWLSDNSDIAKVEASDQDNTTATAGSKQDAQTLARAKATITVDTVNSNSTKGSFKQGSGRLRLFLCQNPWPIYSTFPPDYTWPWQDSSSGIEFYYCRDKNGAGTFDDLPALTDSPITKEGNRNICMFGLNIGHSCADDRDCGNVSGSCLPEVLKEFFFFRENEPGIPSLTGEIDSAGKKVNLHWSSTPNASKYKVYYGLNPGQYIYTADVPGGEANLSKTIDSLVNGLNYYFVVTAISAKNQESAFSNELSLKPTDTTPPAVPNLKVSAGDGKLALFWDKVPEATSYMAYLGTQPRPKEGEYTISVPVRNIPLPNKPNIIFASINGSHLDNNATYCVSVISIDQYGNKSDYATEVCKKPNEPYLISAESASNTSIKIQWLPFVGALGYKIYYGEQPNPTTKQLEVSSARFTQTITNLTAAHRYYFRITATESATTDSAFSNEKVSCAGDKCPDQ